MGLEDIDGDYIVEASACAGDADVGDEFWFALEAFDSCGVCDSLFGDNELLILPSELE